MRSTKPSTGPPPVETETVQVLVADSGPIQSQLLTRALKSRRDFQVSAVALHTSDLHNFMQSNHADVVLKARSEEHTSELQSHLNLVCRLLLEKKKTKARDDMQM